jgi:hypothetical protein
LHGENRTLRRRFDQFGAALAQAAHRPDASIAAWQQVYPEIPLAEIDGRVRDHISAAFGKNVDSRFGFRLQRPPRAPLRIDPADPARVEAMRAALRRRRKPETL